MRICLAQIRPEKGNIKSNIETHKKWIDIAISKKADLIAFPELSLTGYEPELANELATDKNDIRLKDFQKLSDLNKIFIGIGVPVKSARGILISMIIFKPNEPDQIYSKQLLHPDEKSYFTEGKEQITLKIKKIKIGLAICYESLNPEHLENTKKTGADIYLASVAKSQAGIKSALEHFPKIASEYSMPILMVNSIGHCDNFESAGQSTIWNEKGIVTDQLDNKNEGILIYDSAIDKMNLTESTEDNNEYKT